MRPSFTHVSDARTPQTHLPVRRPQPARLAGEGVRSARSKPRPTHDPDQLDWSVKEFDGLGRWLGGGLAESACVSLSDSFTDGMDPSGSRAGAWRVLAG